MTIKDVLAILKKCICCSGKDDLGCITEVKDYRIQIAKDVLLAIWAHVSFTS